MATKLFLFLCPDCNNGEGQIRPTTRGTFYTGKIIEGKSYRLKPCITCNKKYRKKKNKNRMLKCRVCEKMFKATDQQWAKAGVVDGEAYRLYKHADCRKGKGKTNTFRVNRSTVNKLKVQEASPKKPTIRHIASNIPQTQKYQLEMLELQHNLSLGLTYLLPKQLKEVTDDRDTAK